MFTLEFREGYIQIKITIKIQFCYNYAKEYPEEVDSKQIETD
ncbi:MAG: hypothetical protein R6U96_06100 [Promethearchaeia archaeon]